MKKITLNEIKNLREQNNRYEINYIGKLFSTASVPTHSHKLWEIIYVTRKKCIITIKTQVFNLKAGDILIIPPNFPHSDQSSTGYDNYHLNIKNLKILGQSPLIVHDNAKKHFKELLDQIFYIFNLNINNKEGLLNAYSALLINFILSVKSGSNKQENLYINALEAEILSNISNPMFDLKAYIDNQPFNSEYLRHLFIKYKGISPHKFLIKKRIAYAQHLLIFINDLNISIKDVSTMSGFTDQLYFSRVFKKTCGLSPTEFIEQSNKV